MSLSAFVLSLLKVVVRNRGTRLITILLRFLLCLRWLIRSWEHVKRLLVMAWLIFVMVRVVLSMAVRVSRLLMLRLRLKNLSLLLYLCWTVLFIKFLVCLSFNRVFLLEGVSPRRRYRNGTYRETAMNGSCEVERKLLDPDWGIRCGLRCCKELPP